MLAKTENIRETFKDETRISYEVVSKSCSNFTINNAFCQTNSCSFGLFEPFFCGTVCYPAARDRIVLIGRNAQLTSLFVAGSLPGYRRKLSGLVKEIIEKC